MLLSYLPESIPIDLSNENLFNESFWAVYNCKSRFLVEYGGAGGCKSENTAQKLLIRSLIRKQRFVFMRKVARTIRDSQFQLFKDIIFRWGLEKEFQIKESEMDIICKGTGSQLLSAGLDDREKLKSIAQPTGGWAEESTELDENDLKQINLRFRGKGITDYFQLIFTFNPVDDMHWIKGKFFV